MGKMYALDRDWFLQALTEQQEKGEGVWPNMQPFPLPKGTGYNLRLLGVFGYTSRRGQYVPPECLFAESLAVCHQRGLLYQDGTAWSVWVHPLSHGLLLAYLNHFSRSSMTKFT